MLPRSLAKPFSIAGFILAEIYMLLLCLAPYRQGPPAPMLYPLPPLESQGLAPGSPIPPGALAIKIGLSAIFFGPFGALVGGGVGLLATGLLNFLRAPSPPRAPAPRSPASPRADSESRET